MSSTILHTLGGLAIILGIVGTLIAVVIIHGSYLGDWIEDPLYAAAAAWLILLLAAVTVLLGYVLGDIMWGVEVTP